MSETGDRYLPRTGESILAGLRAKAGSAPRVLLRDLPGVGTPVATNGSREVGPGPRDTGRYQVLGEIARGGVGVVMKGRDVDLGRDVAMKLLRSEHVENTQIVGRFVEEAQIDAQLQHPGIVPVYELGLMDARRPFFTMKLVKGKTLAAHLRERRDVGEDRLRFLRMFEQICQTVAYAHSRRVIHRDLKPSNVMVGAFGEVLVVDWGFAKVLGRAEQPVPPEEEAPSEIRTVRTGSTGSESQTGSVIGTPPYMPPEQALGRITQTDERSDVFSMGAILTEILTGRPPYPQKSSVEALLCAARADLEEAFSALDACGAEEEMASLARRCLSPDPGDRPVDAEAVARAVTGYLTSVEERGRAAEIEAAEERVKALADRKARRLTVALAGAVLLAVLVVGVGYLLRDANRVRQVARTSSAVAEALEDAERRWGAARAAAVGNLAPWEAAVRAAGHAGEVLGAGLADEETRDRVARLLAAVVAEHAAAVRAAGQWEKDEALKIHLEDIRTNRVRDPVSGNWGEASLEAYREYGIDLEALTVTEAAARIRSSAIADELLAGLDTFSLLAGGYNPRPPKEIGPKLVKIVQAADTNWQRVRLRQAMLDRDAEELRALADEMDEALLETNAAPILGRFLQVAVGVEEAITFMSRTVTERPDRYMLHTQLAYMLSAANPPRYDEAVSHYRAALALRPGSAMVLNHLGFALLRKGDLEAAIRAYEDAMRARPGYHLPYERIVQAWKRLGRLEETVAEWRRTAEDEPGQAEHWLRLGIALQETDTPAEALAACQRAVDLAPDAPYFLFQLGLAQMHSFQYWGAFDSFKKASELAKTWENPLIQVAHVLTSFLHELDPGIEAWREVVARSDLSFNGWRGLGRAHFFRGEFEDAKRCLGRAIRLYPSLHDPHKLLGDVHRAESDWEKAEAAYRRAVRLSGRLAGPRICLAIAIMRQGSFAEAPPVLQPVTEGRYSAEATRDAQRLIRICEMAEDPDLDIDALDGPGLADLAQVRFYQSRCAEAAELFEAALARDPEVAEDTWWIAMVRAASIASADESLPPDVRFACRRRAVEWLRARLREAEVRLGEDDRAGRADLRMKILRVRRETELAPIRDDVALWEEVDAIFERVREPR